MDKEISSQKVMDRKAAAKESGQKTSIPSKTQLISNIHFSICRFFLHKCVIIRIWTH